MYIWQSLNWPNFRSSVSELYKAKESEFSAASARLIGKVESLNANDVQGASIDLLVEEIIKTSSIEGESLNVDDVRSSIKNTLGLNTPLERVHDVRVDGVTKLTIEGKTIGNKPLTHELLQSWHRLAFEKYDLNSLNNKGLIVGEYRKNSQPMQIISGTLENPNVHYEAPESSSVHSEMNKFIEWFNTSLNDVKKGSISGLERSAISHLWFECIHPFEDGNGRIGRVISDIAISQAIGKPQLAMLSSAIEKNKAEYYRQLGKVSASTNLDVSEFVEWFVDITLEAQELANKKVSNVLDKSTFWNNTKHSLLNPRQTKVINKYFDFGGKTAFENGISSAKYASLASCSKATAVRDLNYLTNIGAFEVSGTGKSSKYTPVVKAMKPFEALGLFGRIDRDIEYRSNKLLSNIENIRNDINAPNINELQISRAIAALESEFSDLVNAGAPKINLINDQYKALLEKMNVPSKSKADTETMKSPVSNKNAPQI